METAEIGRTKGNSARFRGATHISITTRAEHKTQGVNGMKGLADDARPGTPRRIADAKAEEAVTQTLEGLPPAATHWSTRSLAQKWG
jgi:hypothetical protein